MPPRTRYRRTSSPPVIVDRGGRGPCPPFGWQRAPVPRPGTVRRPDSPGLDVGASPAVFIDGEPVIELWGTVGPTPDTRSRGRLPGVRETTIRCQPDQTRPTCGRLPATTGNRVSGASAVLLRGPRRWTA